MSAPRVIRDVPCLNCGAKPGDWCTQPTENGRREVFWVHSAREGAQLATLRDERHALIAAVNAALPAHDMFDPNLALSKAVRNLFAALDWNTEKSPE